MINMNLEQQLITGEEDELEEIINLYGEKLLRYATAILCDYHEAENVVQEVFLAAYQSRTTFDGGNLSAWLYKITYNRSLNQLKKRRMLLFSEIWNGQNRFETAVPTDEKGMSDETLRALKRLKPKERALLYGRIMEDQSYEELSRLLGCSSVTLRKRYERAKKKLADYLASEHYGKGIKNEYI